MTRSLAFAAVVNTFGNGLYLVLSALFFTRIVGLSAANVGLGLSGAALVGLAASTPMGYLADRFGPRNLAVGWFAAQSVAQVAMVFAHSYLWFLVVIVLDRLIDAGARGAWGAVMANAVPEDQRLRTRAYLRSATNLSITVGVLVAGVALTADTRSWYVGMFLANAVTTMLAALILLRVPTIPPVPKPANGPRLGSLRDRPFLTFTVVDGLLSMHYVVVEFAVPLWVMSATGVPRWTVSVLGIINTVMCFLFQTRAAKGADQIAAAARRSRWAGFAVAGAASLTQPRPAARPGSPWCCWSSGRSFSAPAGESRWPSAGRILGLAPRMPRVSTRPRTPWGRARPDLGAHCAQPAGHRVGSPRLATPRGGLRLLRLRHPPRRVLGTGEARAGTRSGRDGRQFPAATDWPLYCHN